MDDGFKTPDINEQKPEPKQEENNFLEKPKENKALEIETMLNKDTEIASPSNFITYVLIFLVAAGVISTYLVFQDKLSDTKTSVNNLSNKISKISTSATPITNSSVNKFVVPELGISILTPSNYSDLNYATGQTGLFSNPSSNAIFLSSKSIANSDEACAASPSSAHGSPLGIIAKINGNYPGQNVNSSGLLLIQTKSYYIAYLPQQENCSTNPSTKSLINRYLYNLPINSQTVSLTN